MADSTAVYLITGFLGSGKTTFLNRLIHQFPKDKKLMILMNEFGEIGVDGTLVEAQELDLLEISKGSIFCACVKTDFIKALYEIGQKIKPDVLLIESTGVANPSDLKKDLSLPIFNNRFQFKEQFCIVDAVHFLDEFEVYASVERQIASSTRFLINKIDLATPEQIAQIKELIQKYHPHPEFYETTYADVNVAELLAVGEAPGKGTRAESGDDAGRGEMTEAELEQYVEKLLDDPEAALMPPDVLMSATFFWRGGELPAMAELSGKLPKEVVRGKGFLTAGGRTYLYNYVLGRHSLEEYRAPLARGAQNNLLVFIFAPQVLSALTQVMEKHGFVKKGELMPGAFAEKQD
ncbi:MAG: CobW family GTP-binding protein [Bacillota bacterium]